MSCISTGALGTLFFLSTLSFAQQAAPPSTPLERVVPIHSSGPIPPTYFGIVMAGIAADHTWPTIPARAARVFDSAWWRVEPQRGVFDWTLLDKDVAEAEQHHLDLDLILDTTPTWASERPEEPGQGHAPPGSRAEAANLSDWTTYVRAVATRYRGRVHTYEMWNEANTHQTFTGDIPALVALCSAAYHTLKDVDPTITVISPAALPTNAFPFMRQFLTQGGASTFDVLGYHFYDNLNRPTINPELFPGTADHIRLLLSQLHLSNVRIWNTESGYYILSSAAAQHPFSNFPPHVRPISQDEAVAAVGRTYLLAWASGVERSYWYAWGEPAYALVDDMGATPKPATIAYAVVVRWLTGATLQHLTRSADGVWVLSMTDRNQRPEWVIWSDQQPATMNLPAYVHASRIERLDDTSSAVTGRTITAGAIPVLYR